MTIAILACGSARRHPFQALLGALAWIISFEVAWQMTANALAGTFSSFPYALFLVGGLLLLGFVFGVRLSWRFLALTSMIYLLWVAEGFHYNLASSSHINWPSEVLNEATKTSFGLVWLWPFLRPSKNTAPSPAYRRLHFLAARSPFPRSLAP
jgi:hypothetical protein